MAVPGKRITRNTLARDRHQVSRDPGSADARVSAERRACVRACTCGRAISAISQKRCVVVATVARTGEARRSRREH